MRIQREKSGAFHQASGSAASDYGLPVGQLHGPHGEQLEDMLDIKQFTGLLVDLFQSLHARHGRGEPGDEQVDCNHQLPRQRLSNHLRRRSGKVHQGLGPSKFKRHREWEERRGERRKLGRILHDLSKSIWVSDEWNKSLRRLPRRIREEYLGGKESSLETLENLFPGRVPKRSVISIPAWDWAKRHSLDLEQIIRDIVGSYMKVFLSFKEHSDRDRALNLAEIEMRISLKNALGTTLYNMIVGSYVGLSLITGKDECLDGPPFVNSIRSGGPLSMPGLMNTLLNIGITDMNISQLSEEYGLLCVLRSYTSLYESFGTMVCGIDEASINDAKSAAKVSSVEKSEAITQIIANFSEGKKFNKEFSEEEKSELFFLIALLNEYKKIVPLTQDPINQLMLGVLAVWASYDSEGAKAFRRVNGYSERVGTAVVIQDMVFTNNHENSFSGALFSRDKDDSDIRFSDDSSFNTTVVGSIAWAKQGEAVVAGNDKPTDFRQAIVNELKNLDITDASTIDLKISRIIQSDSDHQRVVAAKKLQALLQINRETLLIENEWGCPVDVEFSAVWNENEENYTIWWLQARRARMNAKALLRNAERAAEDRARYNVEKVLPTWLRSRLESDWSMAQVIELVEEKLLEEAQIFQQRAGASEQIIDEHQLMGILSKLSSEGSTIAILYQKIKSLYHRANVQEYSKIAPSVLNRLKQASFLKLTDEEDLLGATNVARESQDDFPILGRGKGNNLGAAVGQIYFSPETATTAVLRGENVILCCDSFDPNNFGLLSVRTSLKTGGLQGVITHFGSTASHMALLLATNSNPIPAIFGFENGKYHGQTKGLQSPLSRVNEGDYVSMNSNSGCIRLGKREIHKEQLPDDVALAVHKYEQLFGRNNYWLESVSEDARARLSISFLRGYMETCQLRYHAPKTQTTAFLREVFQPFDMTLECDIVSIQSLHHLWLQHKSKDELTDSQSPYEDELSKLQEELRSLRQKALSKKWGMYPRTAAKSGLKSPYLGIDATTVSDDDFEQWLTLSDLPPLVAEDVGWYKHRIAERRTVSLRAFANNLRQANKSISLKEIKSRYQRLHLFRNGTLTQWIQGNLVNGKVEPNEELICLHNPPDLLNPAKVKDKFTMVLEADQQGISMNILTRSIHLRDREGSAVKRVFVMKTSHGQNGKYTRNTFDWQRSHIDEKKITHLRACLVDKSESDGAQNENQPETRGEHSLGFWQLTTNQVLISSGNQSTSSTLDRLDKLIELLTAKTRVGDHKITNQQLIKSLADFSKSGLLEVGDLQFFLKDELVRVAEFVQRQTSEWMQDGLIAVVAGLQSANEIRALEFQGIVNDDEERMHLYDAKGREETEMNKGSAS